MARVHHRGNAVADQLPEDLKKLAESQPSLLKDFVYFLLHNKKWWLIPLLVVLLLMGLLMMFLSTSAVAPFIYTLF
jgi:hypothetical protein